MLFASLPSCGLGSNSRLVQVALIGFFREITALCPQLDKNLGAQHQTQEAPVHQGSAKCSSAPVRVTAVVLGHSHTRVLTGGLCLLFRPQ